MTHPVGRVRRWWGASSTKPCASCSRRGPLHVARAVPAVGLLASPAESDRARLSQHGLGSRRRLRGRLDDLALGRSAWPCVDEATRPCCVRRRALQRPGVRSRGAGSRHSHRECRRPRHSHHGRGGHHTTTEDRSRHPRERTTPVAPAPDVAPFATAAVLFVGDSYLSISYGWRAALERPASRRRLPLLLGLAHLGLADGVASGLTRFTRRRRGVWGSSTSNCCTFP